MSQYIVAFTAPVYVYIDDDNPDDPVSAIVKEVDN